MNHLAIYHIHRAASPPPLDAPWDHPAWSAAQTVAVNRFHDLPEASDHRPETAARLLYDDVNLYLHFQVQDRYVRVVRAGHQAMVCRDSCVEFFFAPNPTPDDAPHLDGRSPPPLTYFNLETSAGGHALLYHCRYRGEEAYARHGLEHDPLTPEEMQQLSAWTTLPDRVEPEIAEHVTWRAAITIPLSLIRQRMGPIDIGPDARWAGNFYKCGDETSHPHWASWQPITADHFRFHHPPSFGALCFA